MDFVKPGSRRIIKRQRRTILFGMLQRYQSEKFPSMIIRKSHKSILFGRKSGKELGFDYWFNKKSLMAKSLLFDWLARFDSYTTGTTRKKIYFCWKSAQPLNHIQCYRNSVQFIFIFDISTTRTKTSLWKGASLFH